jgi:cellulose synthase operon protein C
MPTIHKMFLLKLVLGLAVFAGLLAGVHTIQAYRIPDALARQSERAAEAEKPDQAIHYLRQYLEFRPLDVDAQERLAKLMQLRPGRDGGDMLLLYDRILRNDPARETIRRDALNLSLRLGRYTDAEIHAQELLKTTPLDVKLMQKMASAQAAMQKHDEAKKTYETAIFTDPKNVTTYQLYAEFLWRDVKNTSEAAAVIDRLIAAVPYEAESFLTRARLEATTNDQTKLLTDLNRAFDLDPENAEAIILLADHYQRTRQVSAARDCLTGGLKVYPGELRMVRSLAWLDLNMGNIGSAVAILEEGMNHVTETSELLVPLADLLVQMGDTARTEEIVKKLEAKPIPAAKLQTKYLRARLHMRESRWPEAIELLQTLRSESAAMPGLENQTNLLIAACRQKRGESVEEQETLKLLLNKDPNHLAARVALAQSYLNSGRTADAMTEYETAVKSPYATPAVHSTLVRLKMLDYQRTGARGPEWAQLDRIAQELTKITSNASSEPTILRAELLEARGELKTAIAVLKAEASRRPGDVKLWVALADRVCKFAGVSTASSILDEAQASAGDGPEVRLARADLAARDPARLRPIESLAEQIDAWPDADQTRFLFGLVEILDRVGDEAAVLRTYQQLSLRRPNDVNIWETLGERALRNRDAATAQACFTALQKLEPTGKSLALLTAWKAWHASDVASAASAEASLVKAFGELPERGDACVLRGKLKLLQNDPASAGPFFERAIRLEPTRFPTMQAYLSHIAVLRTDDAVAAFVQRLGTDHRWAGEPFRRVLRASLVPGNATVAKKLLTPAWQFVEREPAGLAWLADGYRIAGMTSEATECDDKTLTLATTNADDWLRMALRTTESRGMDTGVTILKRAEAKLPNALYISTLASFAESDKVPRSFTPKLDTSADRKLFAQARLGVKLSRFQRPEAIALLDEFLQTKDLEAGDAAWAKRNLAMLLAVRGNAADRNRAVELLVNTTDKAGDTPDEKRSTAAVLTALARHLDGEPRKSVLNKAVKTLEDLVSETRSPRDAYLLAQVYRTAGNRKGAVSVLNNLLQADPKNLDYHIMALEELTEMGQLASAEPFAQRLLALYPTDFRALRAVAIAECKAGRPERGQTLAETYIRTADATAGDLPAKSARVAELLDELIRLPMVKGTPAAKRMIAAAVERYETLIVARPEALVAAAGLLGCDNRHADGVSMIEKHKKQVSTAIRASAGLALVRSGQPSERQLTIVRDWIAAARMEEPNSLATMLNEGEFLTLKLDYAGAEKIFTAVLAKEPRNVVALNNLAWILAPQPESATKALELIDRAVAEVGLTGELLDTRARVRIAAKQFELAERDLTEAMTQDKTGLRMFHMALAKQGQTPVKKADVSKAFRQAQERGLEPKGIHPADLPQYRAMEAESRLN